MADKDLPPEPDTTPDEADATDAAAPDADTTPSPKDGGVVDRVEPKPHVRE